MPFGSDFVSRGATWRGGRIGAVGKAEPARLGSDRVTDGGAIRRADAVRQIRGART